MARGQLPPTRWLSTGCKLNRLNSVVGEYAGACVQVARDCGVDVLDLWTLMQKDTQVRGWLGPQGEHKPTDGTPALSRHDPCHCHHLNQKARVGGDPFPSPVPRLYPAAGVHLRDSQK